MSYSLFDVFLCAVISDFGTCLVWIFGHSFVYWGAERADVRPAGRQLGLPLADARIRWIGIRGMRWPRLLSEFQFFAGLDRAPDVLVIHAGGNDLGVRTTRELLRDVKLDCLRLWATYPGIILVWSDIVARRVWRHARSVSGLNRARAKLNRAIGRFIARNGGVVVRHKELEELDSSLLWMDGVHLNGIGFDMWSLNIREGVEKAIHLWRDDRG